MPILAHTASTCFYPHLSGVKLRLIGEWHSLEGLNLRAVDGVHLLRALILLRFPLQNIDEHLHLEHAHALEGLGWVHRHQIACGHQGIQEFKLIDGEKIPVQPQRCCIHIWYLSVVRFWVMELRTTPQSWVLTLTFI